MTLIEFVDEVEKHINRYNRKSLCFKLEMPPAVTVADYWIKGVSPRQCVRDWLDYVLAH